MSSKFKVLTTQYLKDKYKILLKMKLVFIFILLLLITSVKAFAKGIEDGCLMPFCLFGKCCCVSRNNGKIVPVMGVRLGQMPWIDYEKLVCRGCVYGYHCWSSVNQEIYFSSHRN